MGLETGRASREDVDVRPARVPELEGKDVMKIACGRLHTLVWCRSPDREWVFLPLALFFFFVFFFWLLNGFDLLLFRADGDELFAFGNAMFGQVGTGADRTHAVTGPVGKARIACVEVPTRIHVPERVRDITVGLDHSIVLCGTPS
jgi:alpha-tubulin suppressor-like RCC1 family protein